jgi:hypothetical protein
MEVHIHLIAVPSFGPVHSLLIVLSDLGTNVKIFQNILTFLFNIPLHGNPASCTMGTGGPFPGGKSAAGA